MKTTEKLPALKDRALARALVRDAIENQISFVNAVIPTSLSMTQKQLRVLIASRDRDHGDPIYLQSGWKFPREGISTREGAISWVVACVRETWVHELHESIFVDGTRRDDLHEPGTVKTRPPPRDLVDPWWAWNLAGCRYAPSTSERADATPHAVMGTFALPKGWTWEPASRSPSTRVIVRAPAATVAIDFAERRFDVVEHSTGARYTGRSWREALVADAIETLRACVPRRA